MVFSNLKLYLKQRSINSAHSKDEKVVAKKAKQELKLQLVRDTCAAEEDKRWGPAIPGAVHDFDDEGRNTRAVVHRYQSVVGVRFFGV